jgi:hypothetical protein|tara:strand:- start:2702 stop:2899 length:198 start_codon:yes stop_codon:yes gene_type:complete
MWSSDLVGGIKSKGSETLDLESHAENAIVKMQMFLHKAADKKVAVVVAFPLIIAEWITNSITGLY